ncbi:hypothetical protein AB833_28120 [Chromatiales bacterium (ex Bugula neritina AB1)]|nr:hypothetical protein AB833_28120 [Chromatiales bacterium (ex Bugula neritina AB1)]
MKCKFCEFVKASARDRLYFLKEIIYGKELVIVLACSVVSFLVYLVTNRLDQAGCFLVALALSIAAWNRFNEGFRRSQQHLNSQTKEKDNATTAFLKKHAVGKMWQGKGGQFKEATFEDMDAVMNEKHVGMVSRTDNTFNRRQYHVAEFFLAIAGTLLWGFGASGM